MQQENITESPLFEEAQSLFQSAFAPGSGRPTNALDVAVSPDGKRVAFSGSMLERLEGVPLRPGPYKPLGQVEMCL